MAIKKRESTFEVRYGRLLNNENDKNDNNRRVTILITGNIPIVAGTYIDNISGDSGKEYGLIASQDTDTPIEKDNKNFLVDEDDDDRYVFLGRAQSLLTKLFVSIYYDAMFKDIIILPDLYSLGIEDEGLDFYENSTMTIHGYSVGRGRYTERPIKEIVAPVILDDLEGIPQPKRFDSTTTLLATTYGLSINSLVNKGITVVAADRDSNEIQIPSDKAAPLQYIQFPDNSDLYDDDTPVQTSNMVQQLHDGLSIDHIGKRLITKMVIPISF